MNVCKFINYIKISNIVVDNIVYEREKLSNYRYLCSSKNELLIVTFIKTLLSLRKILYVNTFNFWLLHQTLFLRHRSTRVYEHTETKRGLKSRIDIFL